MELRDIYENVGEDGDLAVISINDTTEKATLHGVVGSTECLHDVGIPKGDYYVIKFIDRITIEKGE